MTSVTNGSSCLATLEVVGRVATLTLNRPDSRNAMSRELLAALHTRVEEFGGALGDDAGTAGERPRVLVITGAGRAFCAGMDLKLVLGDPAAAHALLASLAELCIKIRALPVTTVAKVNHAAIGGGCGLVTVCDVSISHADAKLGFPEVDLGVCPAVVAPWLVRKIGAGPARKVLLTGGLMTGAQAHALGIVDHVVHSGAELDAATTELVGRLAAAGSAALKATKGLLNTLDGSMDQALAREAAALSAKVLQTPETQAMLRAKLSG